MDQIRPVTDAEQVEVSGAPVSRRTFFNRARVGLIAVAGVALFGLASATGGASARESSDDDEKGKDDKKEKQKEKEKEKESKSKSSSKKTSSSKTKKKKKKVDPIAASPYGKYIVKGVDKYNCTDFTNQFDAQATLRLFPQDPNNLDRNRDGIACGGSEAFQDGVPGGFMMPPFDINPVPRP
jgi:hypothetical protein